MKTVLVALNAKFVHSNLALRYIKEYSSMHNIELYETTINDSFMETAMQLVELRPEVVGFSCYLWNVDMAVKISSIIKEVLPETIIVFGGPEVSFNGFDYLSNYPQLDFVISGEGEITFKELLDALSLKTKVFSDINGLSYRSAGQILLNDKRAPIEKLDEIPFPYENEIPGKILYYEAARGCPFSCSYCLSGSLGAIRYFGIDRVKSDLNKLITADVELVKFVDRTFNANKHFANEIWQYLIDNAANTKFHFEIAADLLDDVSIEILRKAPKELFQFEIGVQSTNPIVLEHINRRMDFAKVSENIIKLRQAGNIHCHLDLIAGLPGETLTSFVKSFEDCMEIEPDVLQLGFLKVLKGTTINDEKEDYGINYIKHPNYQVLYTNDISFDELRGLMRFEKVFETYYNSGIFNATMKLMLSSALSENKYQFFSDFEVFLSKRDFFTRSFDLRDKFKLLYEYLISKQGLSEKLKEQLDPEAVDDCTGAVRTAISAKVASGDSYAGILDALVKDLLIYDYIHNTKKAAIPDFLRRETDAVAAAKDRMQVNKLAITSFFSGVELKKLFYMPVSSKIIKHQNNYSVLIENGILICNPVTSEYCYI